MNEQKIRWDDLQIISSITDTGTLSGAGRRLGISHATVFRRLANLEHQVGVTLFERSHGIHPKRRRRRPFRGREKGAS